MKRKYSVREAETQLPCQRPEAVKTFKRTWIEQVEKQVRKVHIRVHFESHLSGQTRFVLRTSH